MSDGDHFHPASQRQNQHIAAAYSGTRAFYASTIQADVTLGNPVLRKAARSGKT
ncbi:hypothetical protein NSE01_19440 [Novosphingobium sediminis]|uniref:Uncharacterized protein n=1 Tax=Novosphingobium sediminis TaxID=707214 RepID=A0A512AK83_9SPHN|nr:hypothetical protein NSE01_19440 [Novosphingobium sediminis]